MIMVAMSSLASLPAEVLKLVMQQVPLKDRLTNCCLVNKRLHAAAVAATQEMELETEGRVQSGLHWMSQYGTSVTMIKLGNCNHPVHKLPCPNLLELQLWLCSVQLGPTADGQPGVIQGCTKLTRLELWCDFIDAPEGAVVDSLSSLVHLQHLQVLPQDSMGHTPSLGGLSSSTLPSLTCLTVLDVRSLSFENLAQLAGLTNLQVFILGPYKGRPAIGPSSAPGLAFPASLTRFETYCRVEVEMLSLLPAGLKDLLLLESHVEGPAEGPGSLLFYIDRLQELTRLELNIDPETGWPPAGPAYSALTASSSLVALAAGYAILPAGVWRHVFPPARKMLHLTHLEFSDESVWGAADVSRLVSCCPNLCTLGASLPQPVHLQHGLYISELHKLSGLTSMKASFVDHDAYWEVLGESIRGLAALTQLQRLHVELHSQERLPVSALLPLTSLTALTSLYWCARYQHPATADLQVIVAEPLQELRHVAFGKDFSSFPGPELSDPHSIMQYTPHKMACIGTPTTPPLPCCMQRPQSGTISCRLLHTIHAFC
jgi:hypothetical protein